MGKSAVFSQDPMDMPRDAKILTLLLTAQDIDSFEPQVLQQLQEIAHRHVLSLIQDAQTIAEHCGMKESNPECVKLSIESHFDRFPQPVISEVATKKNRVPLPLVGEKYGLRLPPERHLLTRQNFTVDPVLQKQKFPPQKKQALQSVVSVQQPSKDEDDYDMEC
ncbi:transcription initiation factor IID, 31kD subunit-domain-containing protein, partial [Gorgonomyces haynaldii]